VDRRNGVRVLATRGASSRGLTPAAEADSGYGRYAAI